MTHPRDHVLNLPVQLRSDMTTLANVTCKVRANAGAATTYTNVTSPAITQYTDCTFAYELKIAASSFADGDVIEATWLYSGTAYAADNYVIGPAEVDGAYYTAARGTKLDQLDAAVSSRSTYAGADTAGTTTLLSRLSATRAGYLDNLTNLDALVSGVAATVWAAGARTLTAISDSAGVTTLVSRLTSGRATALDHLDADVSSRLATSGYTAPDNADVAAIKAKTDNLPADPASASGVVTALAGLATATATAVWAAAARTLTRAPRSEG